MQCLAFSPDGNRVVAGNDEGRLWVVEARTGKTVLECRDVLTALTAGRSRTANTCQGGWVELECAMRKPALCTRWRAHRENVTSIVFSADNQYLATGSGDDTAKVWSVKGGEPLLTPEQGDEYDVTGVAFSPDGHQL